MVVSAHHRKLVLALAVLTGCGTASSAPPAAVRPELPPARLDAAQPDASPAAPERTVDPCEGLDGLVIDPPAPIEADWQGAVVMGGWGPVVLRWCGEGAATVETLSVDRPVAEEAVGGSRHTFEPSAARLARGETLTVNVWAPATPGPLQAVAVARDETGRAHRASAGFESVDDPERAARRAECEAAGGTWAGRGLAGIQSCDRPTRDAGRRCTSDADCEGACIPERCEPLVDPAPADTPASSCQPGREPRLVVGRCHDRSTLFGCHSRLPNVTVECLPPGGLCRMPHVCVD